ncbi:MAG: hypothetical protein ACOY3V_07670 [Pseudomonadota bacterium]
MKTRLGIFVATLLLLPLAGIYLNDLSWDAFFSNTASADGNIAATLFTSLALLGYLLLTNHLVHQFTGNNLLSAQRNYFIAVTAASALLGWLFAYLNLYTHNWMPQQQQNLITQLLLYTPPFALLAPAVLLTRALISTLPGVLKSLAVGIAVPAPSNETLVFTLMPLAFLGLLGGAVWPATLFWLLWLAPLLLLLGLQLLWNENTIFSDLPNGNWGRVICAALAGIIVGNLAVITYQGQGGDLAINLPHPLLAQPGYGVFGLLCLQLGDVLASPWHGKKRGDLFRQKKKFPIPVVVKKD